MDKHEDYCAGHLIEAAIAYFNATGKRKLLDVAIRFANHIDATFRLQNRHWVSGHQGIELALVKLYKTTGNKNYLDLSDWYLEQRGHGYFDKNLVVKIIVRTDCHLGRKLKFQVMQFVRCIYSPELLMWQQQKMMQDI